MHLVILLLCRGYPPEESPTKSGEEGVTVMADEETRLRINASAGGEEDDDSEEYIDSSRAVRGTVSDSDVSTHKDMRTAQVSFCFCVTLGEKATIHQLSTTLSTSKNVLFPGHNHLLTTGADDPTL